MSDSNLENIRKQKEQAVAQYNALMGAEQVLEKLIAEDVAEEVAE